MACPKIIGAAALTGALVLGGLRTALQDGKSLAEVAKDNGVDKQKPIDALVAEAKTHLASEVKDGHFTQAQAQATGG